MPHLEMNGIIDETDNHKFVSWAIPPAIAIWPWRHQRPPRECRRPAYSRFLVCAALHKTAVLNGFVEFCAVLKGTLCSSNMT